MRVPDLSAVARPLLVAAVVVLAGGLVAAGARPGTTTDSEVVASARLGAGPATAIDLASSTSPRPTTTTTVAPGTSATIPPTTATLSSPTPTTAPPPPPTPPATAAPTTAPPTTTPTPPPTTATPPPTTAAPAPPPPGVDLGCERELVDRTNAARAANGLPTLAWDGRVHAVSRGWSQHMADAGTMSHNPRFGAEMSANGVDWHVAGENVGRGSAAAVFDMWMQSPTHRANILSADYTGFAVGCIAQGGSLWITQNLYG